MFDFIQFIIVLSDDIGAWYHFLNLAPFQLHSNSTFHQTGTRRHQALTISMSFLLQKIIQIITHVDWNLSMKDIIRCSRLVGKHLSDFYMVFSILLLLYLMIMVWFQFRFHQWGRWCAIISVFGIFIFF